MNYVKNIKEMNNILLYYFASQKHQSIVTFPKEITITTTLKCNYRCKMCYQKVYTGEIPWEYIEKLEDIFTFAENVQLFGGEPFVYSRINDLIKLITKYGCGITAISNGSLLDEALCQTIADNNFKTLKFSVDAGTSKTYSKIRGGNFYSVLKGIARISQLKMQRNNPFPVLHFNFLLMRSNVDELSKLIVIASEIGVSYINIYYPLLKKEELIDECVYFCQDYSDECLLKAREVAKHLGIGLHFPTLFRDCSETINYETKRKCFDPWKTLIIGVDGSVTTCCGGIQPLGNLENDSIEDLWNNDAQKILRRDINTPQEPYSCRNCRIMDTIPTDLNFHISDKNLQKIALDRFSPR